MSWSAIKIINKIIIFRLIEPIRLMYRFMRQSSSRLAAINRRVKISLDFMIICARLAMKLIGAGDSKKLFREYKSRNRM